METRKLAGFVRTVETGSITRAAAELGLAQPALSQHLASLEAELGVKLLDRTRRGVTPTAAGQAVYSRAQLALRIVADLREAAQQKSTDMRGTVPIGLLPTVASRLVQNLVEQVQASHPQIRLQFAITGEIALMQEIEAGRLDIAILSQRPADPDVLSKKLPSEQLFVLASKKLQLKSRPTTNYLARLPWITSRPANAIRKLVDATLASDGLTPNIVAEIDSLEVVLRMVEDGFGVTVLPGGAIPPKTRLSIAPFFGVSRSLFLCRRQSLMPEAAFVHNIMTRLALENSIDHRRLLGS